MILAMHKQKWFITPPLKFLLSPTATDVKNN